MTRAELLANMEATAKKLTGRAVTFRVRELGARTNGVIQKNLKGECVIDLDPRTLADVRLFADAFTHECAHAVKHFAGMPRRDIDKGRERQIALAVFHETSHKGSPKVQAEENEAEALAAAWRQTVKRHYEGWLMAEKDPLLTVLKILYLKG